MAAAVGAGARLTASRCGCRAAVIVAALAWTTPAVSPGQVPCAVGRSIPAYAHNDYENPRPLFDALALGYQGVEADVHLVHGALLVGHDRPDAHPQRTLASLYLAPLRARIARCGGALPGPGPFLLTIESKTPGTDAYRALVDILREYRDMLTVVRGGRERPGPVEVVLVGWSPPLETLRGEDERLAAVQWYADDPDGVPDAPAHLLRLISLDYGKVTTWDGSGPPPTGLRTMVSRLVRARDAVPGRRARVHNVPVSGAVYRFLLDAGVDLIGTKDLPTTHAVLTAP